MRNIMSARSVDVKENARWNAELNTMCWKFECETQCVGSVEVKHNVLEVGM